MNFYNEKDPFAAAWLRELIKAGHIAPGVVDERSIEDITPNELQQYTQCHFFAGVGVWSYALRQAGWPDDRPVWTGSCPCQPFSTAGKRGGLTDERHLWPAFFHLIQQGRPAVVFGEQVASKDGRSWLCTVRADLEGIGHRFGAANLCACGIGAPHIRQRLYFVADAPNIRCDQSRQTTRTEIQGQCTERERQHAESEFTRQLSRRPEGLRGSCYSSMEHTERNGLQRRLPRREDSQREIVNGPPGCDGTVNGFWSGADFVYCRDGKYRPIESGSFPLVNGAAASMGRLRGYGNALVGPVAQLFIESYMEAV